MSHPPIYNKQFQIAVALSSQLWTMSWITSTQPLEVNMQRTSNCDFYQDRIISLTLTLERHNLVMNLSVRSFVTRDKICNRKVVVKWSRKVKPYGLVQKYEVNCGSYRTVNKVDNNFDSESHLNIKTNGQSNLSNWTLVNVQSLPEIGLMSRGTLLLRERQAMTLNSAQNIVKRCHLVLFPKIKRLNRLYP